MADFDYDKMRNKFLDKIAENFARILVNQEDSPEAFMMKQILDDKKKRSSNMDQLTKLAVNYLNNNKDNLFYRDKREEYETVFALLSVCDSKTADSFMNTLVNDKVLRKNLAAYDSILYPDDKPRNIHSDLNAGMSKIGVVPVANYEAFRGEKDAPEDARVQNIKKLYERMIYYADPLFHKNSNEYKKMLKSMKDVLNYAKLGPENTDKAVLSKMMEDVSQTATDYILSKKVAPSSGLGVSRLNLAFAVAHTADPAKAKRLMDAGNTIRRDYYGYELNMDKIIDKTGIIKMNTHKEILDRTNRILNILQNRINDKTMYSKPQTYKKSNGETVSFTYDKMKDMAKYVVLNGIKQNMKRTGEVLNISNEDLEINAGKMQFSRTFLLEFVKNVAKPEVDMEKFCKDVAEGLRKEKIREAEENDGIKHENDKMNKVVAKKNDKAEMDIGIRV